MSSAPIRTADRAGASPPAARVRRPSWRDPRLFGGVALLALSVLTGVRVLAGADDTVPVLAARTPLAAGERIDTSDLVSVQLRFASAGDADRYLPGGSDLEGSVLLRAVGAGELLPRSAVADGGRPLAELPLAVDPARVPGTVTAGSVVDVFVGASGGRRATGRLLVGEVPVLATSRPSLASTAGTRQVVVGVRPGRVTDLARAVASLGQEDALLLVRRPG